LVADPRADDIGDSWGKIEGTRSTN